MLPVRPVPGATSLGKSVVLPRLANCFAIRAGHPWPACGNHRSPIHLYAFLWERGVWGENPFFWLANHYAALGHPARGSTRLGQKRGFARARELLRLRLRNSGRPSMAGVREPPFPHSPICFFLGEGGLGGEPFLLASKERVLPPIFLPTLPSSTPGRGGCR